MKHKRGAKKGTKYVGTNQYHFGLLLAAARRKKGLTQVELAQQLNTTGRTISYYERESKNPSLEMVKKISEVLGVKPESMLDLPNGDSGNIRDYDDAVDRNLSKKFEVAQKLPVEARTQLKKFIDTLAKANNVPEQK